LRRRPLRDAALFLLFLSFLMVFTRLPAARLTEAASVSAAVSATPVAPTAASGGPADLRAKAACVIDAVSGRILYQAGAHDQRAIASTTKIMTALVVLERSKLDDVVTVSRQAAATTGSSVRLAEGERMTVEDLLYGLLLNSGNDSAVALAEHTGGSLEAFVTLMNARARALGAVATQFRNPHGLDEPGHYSTAYELCLITRAAMANPAFRAIVATRRKVIAWPGRDSDRALHNHNRLLWKYDGADGVKTGYTLQAGRCLVASASRDGWQVIAAVLRSDRVWDDTTALLDVVYRDYEPVTVVRRGELVGTVRVERGEPSRVKAVAAADLTVRVAGDEESRLETVEDLPSAVGAPVEVGDIVGAVVVRVGGVEAGRVDVASAQEARETSVLEVFFGKLWGIFREMITGIAGRRAGL
jgi:D-alanyl-D-alanine carboxypeptidase (penicillin-binding protein 5/6)